MSRSRIAVWALLLAFPTIATAQQVAAITDYLKPIVSKIAADPNAGGWAWETNGNGGYLLRITMDVTGDGRPEIFVTSSLTAAKRIAEWVVFDVSDSGNMHAYKQRVSLPADSIWPNVEQNTPSLVYVAAPDRERERASEDKIYPVYRFTFAFPEIKESLTYVSEEDVSRIRPADPKDLPKLQAILLSDYLSTVDAKWSYVPEWKLDGNDCFFRVEDKDRASKNTDFTPQVALVRLGLAQSVPPKNGAKANQPQPRPTVAPLVSQDPFTAQEASTATSQEPTSSTPWTVATVLIVAAIGLLWLLIKVRK